MKPANFPGRKNARRIRALNKFNMPKDQMTVSQWSEFKALTDVIVSGIVARNTRTKKARSGKRAI